MSLTVQSLSCNVVQRAIRSAECLAAVDVSSSDRLPMCKHALHISLAQPLIDALAHLCHTQGKSPREQGAFARSMAEKLVEVVSSLHAFLKTQETILAADALAEVRKSHKMALTSRIQSLPELPATEATELVQLIAQGPWLADDVKELSQVINGKMMKSIGEKPVRRQNQTCASFAGYLSKQDCQVLSQQDITQAVKLDVLATRCVKVGLILPSAPLA